MVRQHHAAGADADRRGAAGDVADQHRRRRARDAGHVVVLGEPVAAVAEVLGMARGVERVAERPGNVAALADRGKVEDGQGNHAGSGSVLDTTWGRVAGFRAIADRANATRMIGAPTPWSRA